MVTCVYFVPNFPNFSLFCVPVGTLNLIWCNTPSPHAKIMPNLCHARIMPRFAPLVGLMVQHSFNLWLQSWHEFCMGSTIGCVYGATFVWLMAPKLARVLHEVCSQSWHESCIRWPPKVGMGFAWDLEAQSWHGFCIGSSQSWHEFCKCVGQCGSL